MLPTPCTCSKLRRSARIVSALYDEALAPSGLTVAQFGLLRTLERTGPCSLTALAEASGLDRTTLNRNLRPLEEADMVASASGADQRARIVQVTDGARAAMRAAAPHWREAQARIEQVLGGDREALFNILDRVESLRT
jgi:DNA-binding MarR family transcriptional regulator